MDTGTIEQAHRLGSPKGLRSDDGYPCSTSGASQRAPTGWVVRLPILSQYLQELQAVDDETSLIVETVVRGHRMRGTV